MWPWAKSNPPSSPVPQVPLGHSHLHLFLQSLPRWSWWHMADSGGSDEHGMTDKAEMFTLWPLSVKVCGVLVWDNRGHLSLSCLIRLYAWRFVLPVLRGTVKCLSYVIASKFSQALISSSQNTCIVLQGNYIFLTKGKYFFNVPIKTLWCSYPHFRKKIHLCIKTMFIYLTLKVWVPIVMSGSALGNRSGKGVRETESLEQLK